MRPLTSPSPPRVPSSPPSPLPLSLSRRAGRDALVALIALAGCTVGDAGDPRTVSSQDPTCEAEADSPPIAGVSFVAPRTPSGPEALEPLSRIGAEWIAVLPYAFLGSEGEVRFDRERQWWGETAEGVAATIRQAHGLGLRVMLKPHVWAGADWVGAYAPSSEEEEARFEASYAEYILTFAALADSLGVELLVVGTELDRSARERPGFWRGLIDDVRERYRGPLTYAANWDGVADVPFWDRLDFIGVDAFFPLSDSATPTPEELEREWRPIVAGLAAECRAHGKPVLFTEFGYRSIDGAAGNQWELPPERRRDVPANPEAQIAAYEALFRSWWGRPWFAGGFLWKWFADDEAMARALRADYTPQHKPVEETIRAWFGGSVLSAPARPRARTPPRARGGTRRKGAVAAPPDGS